MPNNSSQVESLFAAAAELSGESRKTFLDRECAGHEELRGQLEGLLRAHDRVNHAIDRPAVQHDRLQATCLAEAREAGRIIAGRYKLLEQIGEGGMGTVWVAEQLEPVKRKVALKLIKAGMDSKAVLARFEAERQALALMDHSNIAKVLDGGMTDEGRPYFVMEYVKGVPITEYCDSLKLSVSERLNLFVQVCSAVQHAHLKGIIHRDLKPSNILVAPYDDKPVPKVIDFGLAKALHQRLTERTLHTAHETVIGTPLYMSPEQAQLNNLDVDTRSDIYSLGVLLYELLTGTTPLEKSRFKEAAWDEIRRIIREEEPPRPSTRLSTTGTLPSLAACRQTEPLKLTLQLKGDLDWIVMKALEKERTRRYETANGLAKDVQRYLTGEAVEACPPTIGYRLKKLLHRHRAVALTFLSVTAALLLGIVGSTWMAIRATRAEQLALNERRQAFEAREEARTNAEEARRMAAEAKEARIREEAQRKLAETTINRMLVFLEPISTDDAADTLLSQPVITTEQRQMYAIALEYYQELLEQLESDKATQSRIAAAALKLANVAERIGNEEQAIKAIEIALKVYSRLPDESPADLNHLNHLADCHRRLANLYGAGRNTDEAIRNLNIAITLNTTLIERNPEQAQFRMNLALCRSALGVAYVESDKAEEALAEMTEAARLIKELRDKHPDNLEYIYQHCRAVQGQSVIIGRTTNKRRSPGMPYEELLSTMQRLAEEQNARPRDLLRYRTTYQMLIHNRARPYQTQGKLKLADQVYQQVIAVGEETTRKFPGDVRSFVLLGRSHVSRGLTLVAMGDLDQAIAEVQEAQRILRETLDRVGPNPQVCFDLAIAQGCLGRLRRDNGDLQRSLEQIDLAIENAGKVKSQEYLQMHGLGTLTHWLGERGITHDQMQDYEKSLKDWDEAISFCESNRMQDKVFYQIGRLTTEIQSGAKSPEVAVQEAEKPEIPTGVIGAVNHHYLVVRFYAIAAQCAPAGSDEQNRYAEKAIAWLQATIAEIGPCFVDLTAGNDDFEILRQYRSFQEIEKSIAVKMQDTDPNWE